MELRHLRYFLAVAEHRHFANAAESLGISPPTLTVQIKEIERTLRARLFERARSGVTPTAAGEAFLAEARATLQQFDRAVSTGLRAGRGQLGHVALGYVGSAAFSGILQAQVQAFREACPDVLVRAAELPMERLPAMLEEGRVDIAFVRLPMRMPSSLGSHVLMRDRFCIALPRDHRLATRTDPLRPRDLARETFIVPEQDLGLRAVAQRGRFTALVGATPGSLLAVLTQVSVGAGVAVVPDVLTRAVALPHVVFRPIAGRPIVSEVAAVFRRAERSPAVRNLIDQIVHTPPLA